MRTSLQRDWVKVWDPLVRLLHWSLVIGVALAWLTGDEMKLLHEWAGYAALAIVGVRLVWGAIGTRYARFTQFIHGPKAVAGYAKDVVAGTSPRHLGHNPLGGWMVSALLTTLLALGASGWMMTLDPYFGEEWLEQVHDVLANGLLGLLTLHVAGAVLTGLEHRENLVAAMLSGRKRPPTGTDVA
ncbi:MAG: cytochrome b/b6 domain-containing protein [Pseudomonadota bacterium]